ncbi:FAD:protein FMN transferase [Actinophytocola oryzae]|uniref:FAD:protein FMN transferase n=1 Tax=Actinophytocola oryzae TaxID=502181 RepID=A0A4V3FRM4_9PSEU|nr:FAD:protein FMN transferase [Actinophytocola oryzae]TDV44121.1 thiamine biosynthesis lipoprotein [Actinophytocola oryzae]
MRFVEHVMGMPASVEVPHRDAADAVFAWLRDVDHRFSPFRPDSEVRTGRHGRDLTGLLDLCAGYERDTGGAFRVRLPGHPLDPCGVVKGWAVQQAADMLRAAGVTEFCLNVGGDIAAAGRRWSVGIRHPDEAHRVCGVLEVAEGAVATSGTYERGHHIVDGRTGRPVRDLVSLTVVAADLTTADAVSTAAFAMGAEGIAWADAQPGCLVFAVDRDREVRRSAGLDRMLR